VDPHKRAHTASRTWRANETPDNLVQSLRAPAFWRSTPKWNSAREGRWRAQTYMQKLPIAPYLESILSVRTKLPAKAVLL